MSTERMREMAAAYALDALDADDRASFEKAVEDDAELRGLVDEYRRVAAGFAEELELRTPPADLRDRVLSRAREERPSAAREQPHPRTPGAPPGRTVPWVLLAASLAALAWVGLRDRAARSELETLRARVGDLQAQLAGSEAELARVDSLAQLLSGSDIRFATLTGDAAPSLRLVWSPDRATLLVAASGLPAPSPGRTYQLWGIRGDEAPVSLGTFETDDTGSALMTLPLETAADFDVSAVTDEPAGGSPQPTTQPFLAGPWRSAQE